METHTITQAEHADRMARARSVPCPRCGAAPGLPCKKPGSRPAPRSDPVLTHAARWDAWYAAHPEAAR